MQNDEPQPVQNEGETPDTPPKPVAEEAPVNTRPERMGLPPDNDEEQHVLTVRPALIRAHPVTAVLLLLCPIIVTILLVMFTKISIKAPVTYISLLSLAAVCWVGWFIWWVRFRWTCSLYITNKRTIERRGLLSRSSDEVLHDHVRNINVEQKFFERIVNVGSVGISSAGHSGTEIEVDKIPNPDGIKQIIDAYRDMLGRSDTHARGD